MPHYPPPNNPQVCKVTLVYSHDTRTLVNTYYVFEPTVWTLTHMQDLANRFLTWFNTYMKQATTGQVFLQQIQVRLLDPTNPLAYDLPVSPPVAGTRPGTNEAGNVSLTTSWRSGRAGRAYRGRNYLTLLAESDVATDDRVTSALTTLLASAASGLLTGTLNTNQVLSIFHRPGLIPKPLDNLVTTITTAVIENIIDSQRRRLPGRGR